MCEVEVRDSISAEEFIHEYVAVYGARFKAEIIPEDAIGSHACSLETRMRTTNGIHLGCSLLLPVCTVNCVQRL
jgi:hypothetical protein